MPSPEMQHRTLFSMHSTLDMILPGMAESLADEIFKRTAGEAVVLESLLSDYDPASETYYINERAGNSWVQLSENLWDILEECRRYHVLTQGYFDVALGHYKRQKDLRHGGGMGNTELDYRRHRIRFSEPGMALDFGGIGKGYLLRMISHSISALEVNHCFISFGGSSVLTRGHHPHGNSWPLSYRIPVPGLPEFNMVNHCASFSTGIPWGKTTAHIVNPYTQQFAESNRIAGIQCKDPVTAEVLSTIFILAGPEEAAAMAAGFCLKRAFIAETEEDHKPLIVFQYGS